MKYKLGFNVLVQKIRNQKIWIKLYFKASYLLMTSKQIAPRRCNNVSKKWNNFRLSVSLFIFKTQLPSQKKKQKKIVKKKRNLLTFSLASNSQFLLPQSIKSRIENSLISFNTKIIWIFCVCPPPPPPVTEFRPLYGKSLYKNVTRARGGVK